MNKNRRRNFNSREKPFSLGFPSFLLTSDTCGISYIHGTLVPQIFPTYMCLDKVVIDFINDGDYRQ